MTRRVSPYVARCRCSVFRALTLWRRRRQQLPWPPLPPPRRHPRIGQRLVDPPPDLRKQQVECQQRQHRRKLPALRSYRDTAGTTTGTGATQFQTHIKRHAAFRQLTHTTGRTSGGTCTDTGLGSVAIGHAKEHLLHRRHADAIREHAQRVKVAIQLRTRQQPTATASARKTRAVSASVHANATGITTGSCGHVQRRGA
jgi:hypothetical protein